MYIIVGLGNPGRQYEQTHHNMGFITVDHMAEQLGIQVNRIKFKALIGETNYKGEKVIFVKPQTYMNLSGESVREIMGFYKVDTDHLIVIYDDIDLDTGKIRIRAKGSAGTHNGMRNIIYHLQDENFPRIRVGIRGGRVNQMELRDFVTGGFTKEEVPLLEDAVDRAGKAALCIVSDGVDVSMNRYNVREKKEKAKKELKQQNQQNQQEVQSQQQEVQALDEQETN